MKQWRKRCAYCERPYLAKREHGKYCSSACKTRARRRPHAGFYDFVCDRCHEPSQALGHRAKHCTPCARAIHRERARAYQARRRAAEREERLRHGSLRT